MITWLGFRHVKYGVRPHHIPIMGQVCHLENGCMELWIDIFICILTFCVRSSWRCLRKHWYINGLSQWPTLGRSCGRLSLWDVHFGLKLNFLTYLASQTTCEMMRRAIDDGEQVRSLECACTLSCTLQYVSR
jgi:hypothetical protein